MLNSLVKKKKIFLIYILFFIYFIYFLFIFIFEATEGISAKGLQKNKTRNF